MAFCVICAKSVFCFFIASPLGSSDLQTLRCGQQKHHQVVKEQRRGGKKKTQHKYTHGSQRALSRLLASQHDKPKPHFTPGLAGIYWVSSHPVGERKKHHLTPAKTISQLRDQRENKRQRRKKSRNVTCQNSGRLAENFGSTVYTQLTEFIPVHSSDSME